jgi:hypothetical protein
VTTSFARLWPVEGERDRQAFQLACICSSGPAHEFQFLLWFREEVAAIVRSPSFRSPLARLTLALVEHGELPGDKVHEIVNQPSGGTALAQSHTTCATPSAVGEELSLREDGVAVVGYAVGEAIPADAIPGRRCARCAIWFGAAAFRPNPRLRDGLHSYCRPCANAAAREWRAKNADDVSARNRHGESGRSR